jgi:hypothetical protein
MKGRVQRPARIILGLGLLLECCYLYVLVLAFKNPKALLNLLTLVFCGLEFIETSAYLLLICCFGDSLVNYEVSSSVLENHVPDIHRDDLDHPHSDQSAASTIRLDIHDDPDSSTTEHTTLAPSHSDSK